MCEICEPRTDVAESIFLIKNRIKWTDDMLSWDPKNPSRIFFGFKIEPPAKSTGYQFENEVAFYNNKAY
jgi:hypothetical protein